MSQIKVAQKRGLLQKYYEMACHNLLCYSGSYLMEQAKEGFEAEWKEAQAECELLQEMMAELDAREQKEAVQEVPVLEQLVSVAALNMHIKMQRDVNARNKAILKDCMKATTRQSYTAEQLTGRLV